MKKDAKNLADIMTVMSKALYAYYGKAFDFKLTNLEPDAVNLKTLSVLKGVENEKISSDFLIVNDDIAIVVLDKSNGALEPLATLLKYTSVIKRMIKKSIEETIDGGI